jgi:chemotaxis protein MotB
MAKKKRGEAEHGGGHGWFVTFADLMGLMMSFFVMLVAFSTMDNNKLKIVAGSMRDAFGVQTEVRYSGIIESDGLPTRPKLKNAAHIARRKPPIRRPPTSRSEPSRPAPA